MYGEITAKQLEDAVKSDPSAMVIDVRTQMETHSGMVPGSIHIDLFGPSFLEKIKSLEKERKYYIICRSGNRSDSVAGVMGHFGFTKVFNVIDGMIGWSGDLEYPQQGLESRSA